MTELQKLVNAYVSVTDEFVSRPYWGTRDWNILITIRHSLAERIHYELLRFKRGNELLAPLGMMQAELSTAGEYCAKCGLPIKLHQPSIDAACPLKPNSHYTE